MDDIVTAHETVRRMGDANEAEILVKAEREHCLS